ncbi:sigma-70 family RNA polymerase sigma factor [Archangium lansingense]|uniref:Sigma-70 family RNA polymerase sigma factor n=1 Tax=Archangium lansingense TaxID=2995310 RepID=A0ABT4A0C7_9BACT|nr:sigma-70 family RNA polymerase sigma factor [Archangium lansinium]MCY1074796.1 sigma-70 family RNA polymerase sigma factor [Archangium lansinium]
MDIGPRVVRQLAIEEIDQDLVCQAFRCVRLVVAGGRWTHGVEGLRLFVDRSVLDGTHCWPGEAHGTAMRMPGLTATFLAHAKVRFAPPEDTDAFERLLIQTWETSRAPWPAVNVPAESFLTHLAARLPEADPNSPLEPLLEKLSLTELYLACACMRRIGPAIEFLERDYLSQLPRMLRSSNHPDAMIDDVCQLVRVKLLVSTPESGPKIAEYTGRGTLLSWVRTTAARIANKQREGVKAEPMDPTIFFPDLPTPGDGPERALIGERSRAILRQAINGAFSVLPADKLYLIRLHVVDRLSSYELAALFGVNQSTVSRWLKTAREMVRDETERRLREELDFSRRDFESFISALDSKFELDMS